MRTTLSVALCMSALVVAVSSASWAAEPALEELLRDLTASDPRARALARQLLPRQGVRAVSDLMPLLLNNDPAIAKAAFDILMDIANEASTPGRESDRKQVTDLLMVLVQPDRLEQERIIGLRLLERLVPAGYDIGPIAAMLKEKPMLRDKARTALQRIGTKQARAALQAGLPDADPEFKCALLNSLGQLEDRASLEAIKVLTGSDDSRVRAAAAGALAWTGDPAALNLVKAVVGSADEASRPEAMDALLRLTDAISDKGGNWQIAVKTYLEILDAGKGVEKDAALAGLGRIGDGTCVRPILTAIENADPRTWVGGIDALNRMRGRDVTRRIVEAYPGLPAKTQLVLLAVLGEKAGPEVLPILQQAARSSDSARRLAALEAIGSAGRPEGLETLTAAASEGNAEEKAVARKSILCIGDALRERGKKERAGMAYLAVLECDGDKELRARALEGIAACPTPRAFDAVLAAADEPDLKEPAMPALMTVAARLAASGEREKALAAYEKLRQSGASVETVRTLVKQMRALGAEVDLAAVLGVVTHWWLVGPFELGKQNEGWQTDFVGEPGVKLDASYQSEKGRLTWKHVTTTDDAGRIDLRATVADRDRCIAYAYSEITVEKEMEAVLRLGVDDSERIWLNGEKVFELFVARPFEVDQDQIPVKLQAGSNAILLKIWQNNMPWEFCLRITTPDGLPVMFAEKTD